MILGKGLTIGLGRTLGTLVTFLGAFFRGEYLRINVLASWSVCCCIN